ncbi:unknown [Ruminococcus sp. CAG:330]|nr:unknown [Ruminococcus sp. CAG:330]
MSGTGIRLSEFPQQFYRRCSSFQWRCRPRYRSSRQPAPLRGRLQRSGNDIPRSDRGRFHRSWTSGIPYKYNVPAESHSWKRNPCCARSVPAKRKRHSRLLAWCSMPRTESPDFRPLRMPRSEIHIPANPFPEYRRAPASALPSGTHFPRRECCGTGGCSDSGCSCPCLQMPLLHDLGQRDRWFPRSSCESRRVLFYSSNIQIPFCDSAPENARSARETAATGSPTTL